MDDDGSLAFAERFGFREVDRQVEQVRVVGRDEQQPYAPDGVELVSLAERPDLSQAVYTELAVDVIADIPVDQPIEVSLEDWEREWTSLPEGTFLALAGGEIVGCAGLMRDDDHPERAEHSLTAVRRDWRGRGVATALKQATIAWAPPPASASSTPGRSAGTRGMQRVNERLGYAVRSRCVTVWGPVPLR